MINLYFYIYDSVLKYVNYLDKQAKLVSQNNKTQEFPESKIEDFTVIEIPFHLFEESIWEDRFLSLKNILCETDYYVPIGVNEFVDHSDKHEFNYAIESLKQKGFHFHLENSDLFYFKLPSQGCHKAAHFLWKQPKNENSTPQQLQLIEQLCSCNKTPYTRAMRREIQGKLEYLCVVKAHHAIFVIRIY